MIKQQAIPKSAGFFAVSNEWKAMLHPLGFFPHRYGGERSQVKDHKLISMMSFSKNSRSSGYVVSVTSFPLFLTWARPKEGSWENKAPYPLPFLLIPILLPICWCLTWRPTTLLYPTQPLLPICLPGKKNPTTSCLWLHSHSVSHKKSKIF